MDNETIERKNAFTAALIVLCQEHNAKNASFCCTIGDAYYGYLSVDKLDNLNGTIMAITNVGRLWQHARTFMKSLMDTYEGG